MIDSYKLIFENDSIPGDILSQIHGGSTLISGNRFRSKIDGFIIEDSVNNLAFPIAYPVLDTSKILLKEVYKRYKTVYAKDANPILPWHYIVEFYGASYTIHLTRPASHIFPVSNDNVLRLVKDREQEYLNEDTSDFFKLHKNLDLREMIHILIIGDSSIDVYIEDIYKKIGRYIISPLARQHKISPVSNTFQLNVGRKFNMSALRSASMLG